MNKPWIHADLLEFVANLADVNCSATISDGVMTLEDGTQIDLYALLPQPQEIEMKTFYVSIMVQVEDDADIEEVVQEMDYNLVHEDIVDYQLMEVEE